MVWTPKPKAAKVRRTPPFPFILEALAPLEPEVRPMFGGYAVYVGPKIVFMLRDRPTEVQDNGLWLIFSEEFDKGGERLDAMRREFPSLRPIKLLAGMIRHWQVLPAESAGFESEALYACELALRRDPRLGRVPKSRR